MHTYRLKRQKITPAIFLLLMIAITGVIFHVENEKRGVTNLFSVKENIITNPSFEKGLTGWDHRIYTGAHPMTLNGNSKVTLNLANYNQDGDLQFDYLTTIFTGNNSKVTLRVELYTSLNNVQPDHVITYVLNGTGDHGMYQNSIIDNVSYITKILESPIGKKKDVKINPIRDLQQDNPTAENQKFPKIIGILTTNLDNVDEKIEVHFFGIQKYLDSYTAPKLKVLRAEKNFENTARNQLANKIAQLPTEGDTLAYLCVPYLSQMTLEQKLNNLDAGVYLFSTDMYTAIGLEPPTITIKTNNNDRSMTPNSFQTQTNWLRVADIIYIKGNTSIEFTFKNVENTLGENCFNVDNVFMRKLPTLPTFVYKKMLENSENFVKDESSRFYSRRLLLKDILENKEINNIENIYTDNIGIPIYKLYFDEDEFYAKDSLTETTDATFVHNDIKRDVKIRLRGDGRSHWLSPTKSFRVSFAKDGTLGGKKSINLINLYGRGYLGDAFSYRIASKLNLPALENQFVFLVINDKPYSIMYELEHWQEHVLESNSLPAGDIYGEQELDVINAKPVFERRAVSYTSYVEFSRRIPNDWKKYVSDPNNPEKDFSSIFILNESATIRDKESFSTIIDTDSVINWDIHSVIMGSAHQGTVHNLRLFFDNTQGRFIPIPWDVRMNNKTTEQIIIPNRGISLINPITDLAHESPNTFLERNIKLKEYLNNKNLLDDIKSYKELADSVNNAVQLTQFYDDTGKQKLAYEDIKNIIDVQGNSIQVHREEILKYLGRIPAINVNVTETLDKNIYKITLSADPTIDDFSPVRVQRVTLNNSTQLPELLTDRTKIPCRPSECDLIIPSYFHYQLTTNRAPKIISLETFNSIIAGDRLSEEEKQDFKQAYDKHNIKPYYIINTDPTNSHRLDYMKRIGLIKEYEGLTFLIKVGDGMDVKTVRQNLQVDVWDEVNKTYITNINYHEEIKTPTVTPIQQELFIKSIFEHLPKELKKTINTKFIQDISKFNALKNQEVFEDEYTGLLQRTTENNKYQIKSGTYKINKNIVVPPGVTLVIEPGTTILFGDNASFLVFGTLLASGTPDDRITFTAQDKKKGWGVLGILRENAHAVLVNTTVEYGNSAEYIGIHISGAISAYHSTLIIKDSTVAYNNRRSGDDGVNVKYGHTEIINNTFLNNKYDALDIDFVDPTSQIKRNSIYNSGNDGIDVSGSELTLEDTIIHNSGDKAISIGENSKVTVINSEIINAVFGIAAKDSSESWCIGSKIQGTDVAFAAYNKKQLYSGGILQNIDCEMVGNKQNYGTEVIEKTDFRSNFKEYNSTIIDTKQNCSNLQELVVKEIIRAPDPLPTKKRLLLKKIIENGRADFGVKYAFLKNTCQSYD